MLMFGPLPLSQRFLALAPPPWGSAGPNGRRCNRRTGADEHLVSGISMGPVPCFLGWSREAFQTL